MNFNEYQEKVKKFDTFEQTGELVSAGFIEKILGLTGEAGEAADKFKKIIRDQKGLIDDTAKLELVKELGDVLWYVAAISRYLNVPLEDVATTNVAKLEDRLKRHKLAGEGDNR